MKGRGSSEVAPGRRAVRGKEGTVLVVSVSSDAVVVYCFSGCWRGR